MLLFLYLVTGALCVTEFQRSIIPQKRLLLPCTPLGLVSLVARIAAQGQIDGRA